MTQNTVIERIKSDQLVARKAVRAGDILDGKFHGAGGVSPTAIEAVLLTTLIGEAEAVGKRANRAPTDEEVTATIKKFIKGAEETLAVIGETPGLRDKFTETKIALDILNGYLPKQMTVDEINEFFIGCGAANTGEAMGKLKAAKAGTYDGRQASALAKIKFG